QDGDDDDERRDLTGAGPPARLDPSRSVGSSRTFGWFRHRCSLPRWSAARECYRAAAGTGAGPVVLVTTGRIGTGRSITRPRTLSRTARSASERAESRALTSARRRGGTPA